MIDLASAQQCQAADGHCVTCGDEAIPMRVIATDGAIATCHDDENQVHEVAIDLVAPVGAGDRVLVHAGVAIA
jgi:hydrogenase maturation factor